MAITVDFEPIRETLFDWLNQALNQGAEEGAEGTIPILRAEGDSVRPEEGQGFVDYKFLTGLVKAGMADELLPVEGNPDQSILRGQRNFTVSVTAYGPKAAECIAQIQQSLSSPIECDILRAGGLAVREDNNVSDASVLLETSFEERVVLDVIFGIALEGIVDPGRIEIVEVTSKLPGGKKSTIDKNTGISVSEP